MPGGLEIVWGLVGLAVVGGAALIAARLARRARVRDEHAVSPLAEQRLDPVSLERAAETAERAGDLERALRLRFRAGLLRLGERGVIPSRASITSREVARRLRLREFDRLARAFDAIVYGSRSPSADDLETTKSDWRAVLEKAAAK